MYITYGSKKTKFKPVVLPLKKLRYLGNPKWWEGYYESKELSFVRNLLQINLYSNFKL